MSKHEKAMDKHMFIRAHDIETLAITEKSYEANGISEFVWYWSRDSVPAMQYNLPIPKEHTFEYWFKISLEFNKPEIKSLMEDMLNIDKALS